MKDKASFISKEEPSLDIGVKLTSNICSLNNCTKTTSYKSISVNSNIVKASNCYFKYHILDKLGFETTNLPQKMY